MGPVLPLDGIGTEDEDEIMLVLVLVLVLEVVVVFVFVGMVVEFGNCTNPDRQTPKLGITLVDPVQFADTHDPASRTRLELEHAKQLVEPEPEQLEQLESQSSHVELVRSKNSDWPQVGRQRPDEKTGRVEGHAEHWSKDSPVQLWQSG